MAVPKMLADGGDIEAVDVYPFGEASAYFCIGYPKTNSCTEIKIYEEPGNGAMVPWVAVYHGADLIHRVAAAHCHITYKKFEPPTDAS